MLSGLNVVAAIAFFVAGQPALGATFIALGFMWFFALNQQQKKRCDQSAESE
jgi:DMSO reductase anchor subunit